MKRVLGCAMVGLPIISVLAIYFICFEPLRNGQDVKQWADLGVPLLIMSLGSFPLIFVFIIGIHWAQGKELKVWPFSCPPELKEKYNEITEPGDSVYRSTRRSSKN